MPPATVSTRDGDSPENPMQATIRMKETPVKIAKRCLLPAAMAVATLLAASFWEVIPVEVAPTCRPELQHFTPTRTSIQMLHGVGVAFVGCEYRPMPATRWAVWGLSAGSLLAGAAAGWLVAARRDRLPATPPADAKGDGRFGT